MGEWRKFTSLIFDWPCVISMYNKENNQLDATIYPHPIQRQAIYKVLHTTSHILQSNAPEDGHNYCPKHVEPTLEF